MVMVVVMNIMVMVVEMKDVEGLKDIVEMKIIVTYTNLTLQTIF